ncbi:MAG: hypothetical protein ACR2IJ_05165 [Fluviibacter sp.]
MEEPTNETVVVDDEAALDAELAASFEAVKAGKELTAPEAEVKTETPAPAEAKVEDTSTPPEAAEEKYEFRVPNKGKFESDEAYEKRIELLDLVKRRKLATSEEQKTIITDQIKTAKNQLKTLNGTDRFINPLDKGEDKTEVKEEVVDEALKADQDRLKQLGGVTKEDMQAMLQQERQAAEVKSTLDSFIDRHPELKDEDVREVFFDFVDSNYNWQNKGSKALMTVLELARESMFKPSETIQERVLAGANVQEKVNAMQFPGGTVVTKPTMSPEVKKSVDELVATGMSEEKALQLISD